MLLALHQQPTRMTHGWNMRQSPTHAHAPCVCLCDTARARLLDCGPCAAATAAPTAGAYSVAQGSMRTAGVQMLLLLLHHETPAGVPACSCPSLLHLKSLACLARACPAAVYRALLTAGRAARASQDDSIASSGCSMLYSTTCGCGCRQGAEHKQCCELLPRSCAAGMQSVLLACSCVGRGCC